MILGKTVKFLDWECDVRIVSFKGNYDIRLTDTSTGEPVANASVQLGVKLPEKHVAIKNYSENEGILEVLVAEGIVSEPVQYVQSGFVSIPVCELLVEAKWL